MEIKINEISFKNGLKYIQFSSNICDKCNDYLFLEEQLINCINKSKTEEELINIINELKHKCKDYNDNQ